MSTAQIIVSKDGAGNFKSLSEAIKSASVHGDDIIVRQGEYNENIRIEGNKELSIKSEGDVIIKGSGATDVFTIINGYKITISGFTILHGNKGGLISLKDCDDIFISGNQLKAGGKYGALINDSQNVRIYGNTILKCASPLSFVNSKNLKIEHNFIYNNEAKESIRFNNGYNVEIKNNTIAYNKSSAIFLDKECDKASVLNNIISFNTGESAIQIKFDPSRIKWERNLVWKNTNSSGAAADYAGIKPTDDLSIDPQFVDGPSGNFALKSFSLCIGAGTEGITLGAAPLAQKEFINFEEQYEDAVAQFKTRKYALSLQTFKKISDIYPGNADVWIGIGDCYLALKQYDDGLTAYAKSLKCKPDYAEAYFNLSRVYTIKGRLPEALANLEKSIKNGIYLGKVQNDPDLENLRKTEDCKKLLKSVDPYYK